MLEIGILLLAAALLSILAVRTYFMRASVPQWATWDTPSNLIVVVLTALLAAGCAAVGVGLWHIIGGATPAWHALTGAALLALVIGGGVALRRSRTGPTLTPS